jgi:hypothetical protein
LTISFGLLAKVPELVLRIADAAPHIDATFLGEAVVLLVDTDNFRLECAVRFRSQAHQGALADLQSAGQRLVHIGFDPDRVWRDQCEYGFSRIHDPAEFLAANDNSRVEWRPQLMLSQHHRIDLTLGCGIVLQHGGDLGVRLDDPGIAKSEFFGGLRILGGLLRHAPAANKCLPPQIDALLLSVSDFGARALRLGLGEVRRRLLLGCFALPELGALRVIIEPCQQRTGLHDVALIRFNGDHPSGDLKSHL